MSQLKRPPEEEDVVVTALELANLPGTLQHVRPYTRIFIQNIAHIQAFRLSICENFTG